MNSNLQSGIVIQNLSKTYSNGFQAVKNISLKFYKGQITAYLGRNGAGKTTTLKCLAGIQKISSGNIWINDVDVKNNLETVQNMIGNCPQHNILIEILTPIEHVELYAKLRNPDRKLEEIQQETIELIQMVGLADSNRNQPCKFLSGGMKRKLSIALCYIGKPEYYLFF